MELYAEGDKTSCQLAKEVLLERMRQLYYEYRQRGMEHFRKEEMDDYLYWDNKADALIGAMERVREMDCNDLVPYAKKYGIDLPSAVIDEYSGAMGELKKQLMNSGLGTLFSNIKGAAHIISNFQSHANAAINNFNNYISGLSSFSMEYMQKPDGSWIVPWYLDQGLGQQYADYMAQGNDPPVDIRNQLIIQYENEVYEFFLELIETQGEAALCRYINSFANNAPENIALNTMQLQIYVAQMTAFSRIENFEQIAQMCLDASGNITEE